MSTENPRRCPVEYEREGGHQRGDRIVHCHLNAGHPGEHEEEGAGVTWVNDDDSGSTFNPELTVRWTGVTTDEFAERFREAFRRGRITVLPTTGDERERAAYARGISEGRRQATERFISECEANAAEYRRRYRLGPPPSTGLVDERPRDLRSLHIGIGMKLARDLAQHRLLADGPWEPTEQPDPITPEVYAEFFPERDDAGVPLPAEQPEDGTR